MHYSWAMIIYIMADEQNVASYTTAGSTDEHYNKMVVISKQKKRPYTLTSLHLLHSYHNYWTNMRQLLAVVLLHGQIIYTVSLLFSGTA